MKRLLGLTGITYLSVLAAVFYSSSSVVLCVIAALSAMVLLLGIFFKIIKIDLAFVNNHKNSAIAVGVSALCACISFTLFTNAFYVPLVKEYNNSKVNIQGYICDEITVRGKGFIYEIQTDEINGKDEKLKIQLTSYHDLNVEEFDNVSGTILLTTPEHENLISNGIYFVSCDDENVLTKSGDEKRFVPYAAAVSIRKQMKQAFDVLLPDSQASLCKAVLLGDKAALSSNLNTAFTNTGTTFMIVVSGMHLSIVVSCVLFLLNKFIKNRFVSATIIFAVVISFIAITGCNKSVIRSGVMVMISYGGKLVFRRADSINSLGCAALVLTLFNPYAVADIGMLLSFSATAGIVLWSNAIRRELSRFLPFKNTVFRSIVSMFGVSLAASLWVLPITITAFGTVSPFVPITSIVLEPLVTVILAFSLVISVLYLIPILSFISYPCALVCGIVCNLFSKIILYLSDLPYICVNTEKPYFYLWLAITIAFVFFGYLISAKRKYIYCSTALSLAILMTGWGIYSILDSNKTTLTVYSVGYGTAISVENGRYLSLLSCGGSASNSYNLINTLSKNHHSVDNVIIPESLSKYDKLLDSVLSEFDVSNVLVYDNDVQSQKYNEEYDGNTRRIIPDNTSFTLKLSPYVNDTVMNINGNTLQYVQSENAAVLFIGGKPDIKAVPEYMRSADYVILSLLPENSQLLNCKNLIFSGTKQTYDKNVNSFREISSNIQTTFNSNIEILI